MIQEEQITWAYPILPLTLTLIYLCKVTISQQGLNCGQPCYSAQCPHLTWVDMAAGNKPKKAVTLS